MDFDHNNTDVPPPVPPQGPPQQSPPAHIPDYYDRGREPRKGRGWRIFFGVVLSLSILANIMLLLMMVGVAAVFATGAGGFLHEQLVRDSDASEKIAIVSVEGIIHGDLADHVYRQLKAAGDDDRVKGVIVRVNSPGGTISGSDRIYNDIRKFRSEHGIPVVAFMQTVAASGGYYASVACEQIIAEPTAVTGSIGVISWWLVVEELLENKLGIVPVTVKSGERKDWPSSFRKPTAQELKYIEEKLINPAFERFLAVVAEGRKDSLDPYQITELADGGIFGAEEAKRQKLIDDIGYLDDAIALVKRLARIKDARVVEYRRPFSLGDVLLGSAESNVFKLDRNTLYEIGTPQILYLWTAY